MSPIRIFISSRMSNGELDDDRKAACALVAQMGSPFSAFAIDKLPDPPIVFPSDAESEISRSQMFVLLMARTLSPRVVDELRFAQRLGLACYVLLRGDSRTPAVSAFLKSCGCPVYPYGDGDASLANVLGEILRDRISWNETAEAAIEFGCDAWDAIVLELRQRPERVYALTPRRFEELVAELLRGFGYQIELTPTTNDGGRDIIARRSRDIAFPSLYYVEAKLWAPDTKVGRPIIQKLLGAGKADQVNGVMLITPSQFARTVVPYLEDRRLLEFVRLVDGKMLPTWYLQYLTQISR